MLLLVLLCSVLFPAFAVAADSPRQVQYQAESLVPQNIVPTFDNGHVAVYGRDCVSVYAPDGTLAYRIPFPKKGDFVNVAVDTDRSAAAAVQYEGSKGGVSIFDPTGKQTRFLDTGDYSPSFVCFGPDHSIWVTGTQSGQSEFFILRQLSREGKQLGAFLPRSSFEGHEEPAEPIIGVSGLRIAKDRVGMFLRRTRSRIWVETDLGGREIGRWRAASGERPATLTPTGAVYAQRAGEVVVLDRETGEWNPVAIPSEGHLIGAEGESLVFAVRGSPSLRWVPLPRPRDDR